MKTLLREMRCRGKKGPCPWRPSHKKPPQARRNLVPHLDCFLPPHPNPSPARGEGQRRVRSNHSLSRAKSTPSPARQKARKGAQNIPSGGRESPPAEPEDTGRGSSRYL